MDLELVFLPELRDASGSPCAETCECPLPGAERAGAELGFKEGRFTVPSGVDRVPRCWVGETGVVGRGFDMVRAAGDW